MTQSQTMQTLIVPEFKMAIGSMVPIGPIHPILVGKYPKEVWWQVGGGIIPSNKTPSLTNLLGFYLPHSQFLKMMDPANQLISLITSICFNFTLTKA